MDESSAERLTTAVTLADRFAEGRDVSCEERYELPRVRRKNRPNDLVKALGLSWKPNQRISTFFRDFFADGCEIIAVTEAIARQAGVLRGRLKAAGSSERKPTR